MDDPTHPRPATLENSSIRESRSTLTLDQLWQQFGRTSSEKAFCSTWLALQCRSIDGVAGGVVLLGAPDEEQAYVLVASWPEDRSSFKHLSEVAERALKERRGLVLGREGGEEGSSRSRIDIAYPIQVSGQIYGVVALDVDPRPEAEIRGVMRELQWGSAWMEVLCHRGRSVSRAATPERLQAVVNLMSTVVSHKRFHGAAVALSTALATRFDCDRVSVGFLRRGSMQVEALSHSGVFAKETNLVRAIGGAMNECLDQETTLLLPHPPHRKPAVTRAHVELASESGNKSICSVPLPGQDELVGVMTLERAGGEGFDDETVAICESLVLLVGPILETLRRDDRWLVAKAVEASRAQVGAVVGPGHIGLKLSLVGILALTLFLTLASGTHRVTSDVVVEPSARQAVVAAYDGYIKAAPLRAGDIVGAGQELVALDDRALLLERNSWQSREDQSRTEYYQALGNGDAAQLRILSAQMEQATAQVDLLDEQISRTRIAAPFDGVIVTGDLSQSLGAPVERGQVLFELAPLDTYRVILRVDERDIRNIAPGQSGTMVLSGFADESLPFSVMRLTPVSTADEGRNFFRVEAELEDAPARLRPGMEGVGKVDVGSRRLIWIWTHEITDWLRLSMWNWLP